MILKIPYSNKTFRINLDELHEAPITSISKKDYNKVFVVGMWKTGTTSIERMFRLTGLRVGNQAIGELLSKEVLRKKFDNLVRFIHTADAFQDSPFMFSEILPTIDENFPGSKFILTTRDDPETWHRSLCKSHIKKFSSSSKCLPTEKDLAKSKYIWKGWTLEMFKMFWNYPIVPLYDKEFYCNKYETHNDVVREYFRNRSQDFLEINISDKTHFDPFCNFLGIQTELSEFPWENKT